MGVFVSYPRLLFNQTLACATMCCGWLGVTCVLHLKRIKGLSCVSLVRTNMTRVLLQYCQFSQNKWELRPLGMQPHCPVSLLCMDMCHWLLTGLEEILFLCLNYLSAFSSNDIKIIVSIKCCVPERSWFYLTLVVVHSWWFHSWKISQTEIFVSVNCCLRVKPLIGI